MIKEQEVFILANDALVRVVEQIKDDQWEMAIPEWFQVGRLQENMTLRKVINYHAYDDAWVPETLAGKTVEEVGAKYDGDLLGDDPQASFREIVEKSNGAVRALDDPEKIVHLTYGEWPARDYLQHITSFRGFRAYDISKLIGADTRMSDDLVQGMWELLSPHAEEWRKMGVYREPVEVGDDADLQTKLLAMSGRSV